MVSTNDLRNGMTLLLNDELWQVVEQEHHKPGKGQAVVRTKLKSVDTGKTLKRTFRASADVEQAILLSRDLQFLYKEGRDYVFMDTETYEQRMVAPEVLGDATRWLVEGDTINAQVYDNKIVDVELPAAVTLTVDETEPGYAGDTATNATKPATLETGVEIQVPLFIEEGEQVKVDTRSGEYQSRA